MFVFVYGSLTGYYSSFFNFVIMLNATWNFVNASVPPWCRLGNRKGIRFTKHTATTVRRSLFLGLAWPWLMLEIWAGKTKAKCDITLTVLCKCSASIQQMIDAFVLFWISLQHLVPVWSTETPSVMHTFYPENTFHLFFFHLPRLFHCHPSREYEHLNQTTRTTDSWCN